jgi:hypothetical protein
MTRAIHRTALLLGLALVLQPLELMAAVEIPAAVEIARGGGGHGGGHGGGGRAASRGGSGARTGFSSFSGGSNRSSLRLETRPAERSGRVDTRQGNRTDRTDLRQSNRTDRTDLRQGNRSDRVNDRNRTRRQAINTWDRNRPNWVNNNWNVNRPWRYGWYGGSTWNNWGWWPGRAAAWGLGSLATFAVIDSLVDSAVNNETSYIVVPDSDYSLYYSSVQPTGDLVSFQADDGSNTLTFRADCRSGTLNGYPPQNADEAQLLNAACQVAFGQ